MPPKQAKLGYVKPSQQTLGCGCALRRDMSTLLTLQQQVLRQSERQQGGTTAIETDLLIEVDGIERR